ncbi:hypothetical protein HDU96_011108, partial [Phlyctochytrium bullatum]
LKSVEEDQKEPPDPGRWFQTARILQRLENELPSKYGAQEYYSENFVKIRDEVERARVLFLERKGIAVPQQVDRNTMRERYKRFRSATVRAWADDPTTGSYIGHDVTYVPSGRGAADTRILSIDPGERVFVTAVDENGNAYQFGKQLAAFMNDANRQISAREHFIDTELEKDPRLQAKRRYLKYLESTVPGNEKKDVWDWIEKELGACANGSIKGVTSRNRTKGICKRAKTNLNRFSHEELLKLIRQKVEAVGGQVLVTSEAYTTKTCSCCGHQQHVGTAKVFACKNKSCGAVMDRDVNAAVNIMRDTFLRVNLLCRAMSNVDTFYRALFFIVANLPGLRDGFHSDVLEKVWTTTDTVVSVAMQAMQDAAHLDAMDVDMKVKLPGEPDTTQPGHSLNSSEHPSNPKRIPSTISAANIHLNLEIPKPALDDAFGEDDPLLRLTPNPGNVPLLVSLALDRIRRNHCLVQTLPSVAAKLEGVWELDAGDTGGPKTWRVEGLVLDVGDEVVSGDNETRKSSKFTKSLYDSLDYWIEDTEKKLLSSASPPGQKSALGLTLLPTYLVVGLKHRASLPASFNSVSTTSFNVPDTWLLAPYVAATFPQGLSLQHRYRDARMRRDEALSRLYPLMSLRPKAQKPLEEVFRLAAEELSQGHQTGDEEERWRRVSGFLRQRAEKVSTLVKGAVLRRAISETGDSVHMSYKRVSGAEGIDVWIPAETVMDHISRTDKDFHAVALFYERL